MSKDSSLLQIFNTFQTSLNIGVFHGIFVNSYVTRSLMRKPQQSFKAWRPTQRCKGAIHRGHFFPLKSSKLKPDPETIPLGVGALKSVLKIFCQGPMLWFFNIFAEKFGEKNGVFESKQSTIMQKFDHDIVLWEKRQFFRRKLSKIAEKCDHNIDPRFSSKFHLFWLILGYI
jgi:hypothetical protein